MSDQSIKRKNRRYKRKRRRKIFKRMLFLTAIWCISFFCIRLVIKEFRPETADASGTQPYTQAPVPESEAETGSAEVQDANIYLDLQDLYSPCIILKERDSGKILAQKNSSEKIYPASLTKIMTAILAIENTEDFSCTVTLPTELFQTLYLEHASLAGFEPEETVTLNDLLYGIMLPSGAECCIAYAEHIAGSESDFVGMMNKKADELGMENTHYTNTTGLHDENHYTTVADLAILLEYALQDPFFRTVFTSQNHTTLPSALHPEGFTFTSTLFEAIDGFDLTTSTSCILGGKTGYTQEAGLCLASLSSINGKEYLLVTAHADGTHNTKPFHVLDARNLYGQLARY